MSKKHKKNKPQGQNQSNQNFNQETSDSSREIERKKEGIEQAEEIRKHFNWVDTGAILGLAATCTYGGFVLFCLATETLPSFLNNLLESGNILSGFAGTGTLLAPLFAFPIAGGLAGHYLHHGIEKFKRKQQTDLQQKAEHDHQLQKQATMDNLQGIEKRKEKIEQNMAEHRKDLASLGFVSGMGAMIICAALAPLYPDFLGNLIKSSSFLMELMKAGIFIMADLALPVVGGAAVYYLHRGIEKVEKKRQQRLADLQRQYQNTSQFQRQTEHDHQLQSSMQLKPNTTDFTQINSDGTIKQSKRRGLSRILAKGLLAATCVWGGNKLSYWKRSREENNNRPATVQTTQAKSQQNDNKTVDPAWIDSLKNQR